MKRRRGKIAAPLVRAVLVVAAVGIVTTGVTFAALQSQNTTLVGNTISSATAALQISRDAGTYASSQTGFDFANVIPGGVPVPAQFGGNPMWLKNTGNTSLGLRISLSGTPTVTGDVDLSKVSVLLTPYASNGNPGTTQNFSLAALIAANASGGLALNGLVPALYAGSTAQYNVQVAMATDAFSGQSATIQKLDLVFAGVVAN